ncbi:MAG: SRPBCC family protein [Bdellovibrionales bacterium]|nr:SRPBCC family protein [Bdellovibrionales bacterium]
MLKKILLVVVGLFVVLALLPAVLSSKVEIVRSIDINAEVDKTHLYLSDFQNFASWSPFAEEDPTSKSEAKNSGVGSTFSWVGERTGEGVMKISEIVPNKAIKMDLEFYKPMDGIAKSEWQTEKVSDGVTKVTWTFEQELPYARRYFGLMMDTMMGGTFEKGLQNLKNNIEAQP